MEPLTLEDVATAHVRYVWKQRYIPVERHPQSHGAEISNPHSRGPGTVPVWCKIWVSRNCDIGGYQYGIAEDLSSCQTQNLHGRVRAYVNRKGMVS